MQPLRYPQRQQQLEALVRKLGLAPTAPVRWDLLDLALTHSTVSAQANYEQLEFIGDAVVKLAAAELLLETYPESSVGEMTAIRSVLVSNRILAQLAQSYSLERYLLTAGSALVDKGGQQSRLADAFEAVLAALYLSTQNLALIRPWLDGHFQQLATEIQADPARQNYKAALQEWTQHHYKVLPEYRTTRQEIGTEIPLCFQSEVWIQGQRLGTGQGKSGRAAEQAAAQIAFLTLQKHELH